jgi:dolichol-phosphate mannosyltransferase
MEIAVIIPTYNEKENIPKLIEGIFGLSIDDLKIIVVDDNSPDGTGKIIADLRPRESRLHLIQREKKAGLGTAYLAGFNFALENGAQYIFEMDADFSHDPAMIPIFLEKIKNYDLVLGSRYIPEGKIENWNLYRRLVSRLGNFYARQILNLPIRDLTSGFKCYRRCVLEHLVSRPVDSIGYVFQIETTHRAYQKGFSVKEIPIVFSERRTGESKFNGKILWESFWRILKLRKEKK